MSKSLFTLVLFASASFLPLAAHADTVDDFTLTGDSTTITYSLPGTVTFPSFESPELGSATFIPGTYTLESLQFTIPLQPFPPPIFYDLTITPEPAPPTVPEPSSLLLFVSGAAGLLYRVMKPRPPQTFF
jgi:hypothetical protein